MLTFEKVLDVFTDYLQQDPLYEVVLTSHGYTLMAWEPRKNQWYTAEIMENPEILLEALLCKYAENLEDQLTDSKRDLTAAGQTEIYVKALAEFVPFRLKIFQQCEVKLLRAAVQAIHHS